MKKYIIILFSMLLLAGGLTNAQTIKRSKQKTDQTQTNNNPKKSNKTPSKSSKPDNQKPNNSASSKKNKSKKADTSPSDQGSKPSRSNSGVSSSLSTTPSTQPAEPLAYDVTFFCNVPDADMYIDGDQYGHPKGTHTLKKGNHKVKLVAEGYEDYTTTIQVKAGNTSFNFTMTWNVPVVVQQLIHDMVFVEGGTFTMGATKKQGRDANNDEKPAHQVTLSDYYISKYEVTQELWQAVMGKNPSFCKGNLQRPVDNVSWNDCQEFITKLNTISGQRFRLPTEAEWEYAARGGNRSRGYKYSGSNKLISVACYTGGASCPVGSKSPNELGLYDMSGNVWEWCQDWKSAYNSDSQTNPKGPNFGSKRVTRGGGWGSKAESCRVSTRGDRGPSRADADLGLRLAASSL